MDAAALARLITSTILERALCLSCIAKKSGATEPDALRAIEAMQRHLRITLERGERCRACGSAVGPVYSLLRTTTSATSDVDISLLASLIADAALCGDCMAHKLGVPRSAIDLALQSLRERVRLTVTVATCHACLNQRVVHQLG
jgi:hypothetical protein